MRRYIAVAILKYKEFYIEDTIFTTINVIYIKSMWEFVVFYLFQILVVKIVGFIVKKYRYVKPAGLP